MTHILLIVLTVFSSDKEPKEIELRLPYSSKEECLNADALATALMIMDFEAGITLVEKLDGYESFYILEDDTNRFTTGFKDYLSY